MRITTPKLDLRFRVPSAGLLALPWREPLAEWDATSVDIRDIPVGPSRHLVRFVETDGRLWALKELPHRIALKEYDALREIERRELAAVRPAGLVVQPIADTAILVTHFLERSWQYRRLLMRVPTSMHRHRARLLDAIASLLVDLHRTGIYWGDCSLANTLFRRDGQDLQAWLVDAETAELHAELTDGQRALDLQIMEENLVGGLLDVAARLGESDDVFDQLLAEAEAVVTRYHVMWDLLHDEPIVGLHDREVVEARLRRLNDQGFAVDEVQLEPADDDEGLRLRVAVGGRTFHAGQLHALTGLDVGEGQATILFADLRDHQRRLQAQRGTPVADDVAGRLWLTDVFAPGMERAHRAVGGTGDPAQAYCDLLEVRWLLSEEAGTDVGDEPALEALARGAAPRESAADLGIVDVATRELPVIRDHGR